MPQQFPTNHNFCLKVVTGRLVLLQAIKLSSLFSNPKTGAMTYSA